MAKKIRASAKERLVAVQGAVNISEREIAEEDREKVFAIEITGERPTVGVGPNRKVGIFHENACYRGQREARQGDSRLAHFK